MLILHIRSEAALASILVRTTALSFCAAALAVLAGCGETGRSDPGEYPDGVYDLWIRNGTVVDGTGRDRYAADVLVRGDEIAYVGPVSGKVTARRTLDAAGKIVAPGFIDLHSHGDPLVGSLSNFLAQGITTAVLGQDGVTAAFEEHDPPTLQAWRAAGDATSTGDPLTLAQWMRRVHERGSEVNIAALSGHGSLRRVAGVGSASRSTAAQMTAMQEILRADLAAGAFGLSFGLEYDPGRYAPADELRALGGVVGQVGGVVMSHMRTEDTGRIGEAVGELLAIDGNVHVSHIKIVAGESVEEARAVLDRMQAARAGGRRVTADVYPYLASAANLVFLYPDWAKQPDDYKQALKTRRGELEAHIRKRVQERLGPEAILFVHGPLAGKRLSQVAAERGKPYEKVVTEDLEYGGPRSAHFVMTPKVHETFVLADQVGISTDGAPWLDHPRSAGSFPKVLEDYVGEGPGKMRLERATHKMTGLSAQILGLKDRGVIARGAKADLLVLSLDDVHSRATWTEPMLPPSGVDVVIVNGAVALEGGKPVARKHGKILRRAANAPAANTVTASTQQSR